MKDAALIEPHRGDKILAAGENLENTVHQMLHMKSEYEIIAQMIQIAAHNMVLE